MFSRSRAQLHSPAVWLRQAVGGVLWSGALSLLVGCSDDAAKPACAPSENGPPTDPGCAVPSVSTAGLGRFASATAWSDERLAVASWDTSRGALVVAFYPGPGAAPELRVVAHGQGGPTRIAAEPDGHIQVAWFDRAQGRTLWTRGNSGGFAPVEPIGDGPGVLGSHLALALDSALVPHLALRDDTRRALAYATRGPTGWRLETVDTCAGEADCPSPDEDAGEWAQLALVPGAGGESLPRIAFYDRLRGDLKLAARGEDGRWSTSTLDGRDPLTGVDTGDVGRFITLATTPARTFGLAYFDATREALRYLGPGEAPRIVDAGLSEAGPRRRVNVGQHASLRYDAAGQAHILYADTTTPALRHLTVRAANASRPEVLALPAGAWPTLTRVDSGPDAGVRLLGAYAAFGASPARVSLEVFALELGVSSADPGTSP